jgi:imidazoleglycerol-phosphate dehydratase
MRQARVERETRETKIELCVNVDGRGRWQGSCPVAFLGHLLEAFCCHGLFDIEMRARGDVEVDPHHLVEDCGLVLGQAFAQALGDGSGIARAGFFLMPMDEALGEVAVDLCGRPAFVFRGRLGAAPLAGFAPGLALDFLIAMSRGLGAAIHAAARGGRSDHHKLEALFKALGRALAAACRVEPRRGAAVPSSKGVL